MRAPLPGRVPGLILKLVVCATGLTPPSTVHAQENPAPGRNAELEALRRQVEELRRADAEKQKTLEEMKKKLDALIATRPAAGSGAQPAPGPQQGGPSPLDRAVGELPAVPPSPAATTAESVASDAASRDVFSTRLGAATLRLMDISFDVLAAGGGSTEPDSSLANLEGGGHDPRKNGFTLQNAEIALAGAVDPYFVGQANIVYTIDPVAGATNVELEEAFLVSQSLPYDLQVKAGQYFTEFGRINARHPHQWEWMDQPVINTRMFGPDGMRGTGARVSWLVPLAWFSELYAGAQNANGETMTSFLASEESFQERPIGNRPFVGRDGNAFNSLAYSLRWENGFDLSSQWSAALGVSTVFGPNATGNDGYTFIYGADLVMKWRPVRNERGWRFFLWQSEVMYRDYQAGSFAGDGLTLANKDLTDWGFYTQLLYGWSPGWRGGVRFDYATGSGDSVGGRGDDPFRDNRFRVSPLVEWLPSEFSRVRFQINYDHADHLEHTDALTFWIGYEFLIGSHAAHRY